MKSVYLSVLSGLLLVVSALPARAQDGGEWRAASSNARDITGDIAISPSKLILNFLGFPMAPIRGVTSAEVMAVFAAEPTAGSGGHLYRLNISGSRRFLRHNTLCGTEDTQWMVTTVADRKLYVAFFSGSDTPVFTPEALEKSTDLCGTFTYAR